MLEVTLDVNSTHISFYRKVSSEFDYDFLKFYIDEKRKGKWSGEQEWSLEEYPISPGQHSFKWTYEKDSSVSDGSDCAWIDLIELY